MSSDSPTEAGQPGTPQEAGAAQSPPRRRGGPGRATLVTLIVLLPVLLILGIWIGGHPRDLPSFMRSTFEANHQTEVTAEAINQIAHDYYRPISKSKLASSSIAGAVTSLDDPFSNYLSPSEYGTFATKGHFSGVGVEVAARPLGLLIERVFDASPAERAGLKRGETIVGVNGRALKGLSEQAARALIVGPPGTAVKLTVKRGSSTQTVTITRETISAPVVASEIRTFHGKKIGIVALTTFDQAGVHAEVREAVEHVLHEGAQGIVFDLRRNGGGLVTEARLVASIFVLRGLIVTMRARTQPTLALSATGGAISPTIPMVVLVDRDTASAAEIVTAALQDHHRATVVGTHTFGKGVFQELEPLSNGGALDITVGEYFTPNGRNLGGGGVKEGAGITPEVPVAPTEIDSEGGVNVALETLAKKLG